MRTLALFISHGAIFALGFALGIYVLPILTAPDAPSAEQVRSMSGAVRYKANFKKDIQGSDLFHWAEGQISISPTAVTFMGEIAPGPDYKLYLLKDLVETREAFLNVKSQSVQIGDVKTFDNFIVSIPADIDINQYNAVLIWCESFEQFISAARYR